MQWDWVFPDTVEHRQAIPVVSYSDYWLTESMNVIKWLKLEGGVLWSNGKQERSAADFLLYPQAVENHWRILRWGVVHGPQILCWMPGAGGSCVKWEAHLASGFGISGLGIVLRWIGIVTFFCHCGLILSVTFVSLWLSDSRTWLHIRITWEH